MSEDYFGRMDSGDPWGSGFCVWYVIVLLIAGLVVFGFLR